LRPIHGWIHVACIENGDYVAAEMHGRIMQSGLYKVSDVIHVAIVGGSRSETLVDYIFRRYPKYDIHYINEDAKVYEWPSLIHMHSMVKTSDLNCWYVHTKGASNCRVGVSDLIQNNIRSWRDLMCQHVMDYKTCRLLLDSGYDAVGPLLRQDGAPHFAGNFWWATSDHLRKLSLPSREDLNNRNMAEQWVCTAKDSKYYNLVHIEATDLYGFNSEKPFEGL
jgi:hypothetical protein